MTKQIGARALWCAKASRGRWAIGAAMLAWALCTPGPVLADADPSPVANALACGENALAEHDPQALMAAAAVLAEAGAHPQDPAGGEDDLALLWAHQAVRWGAAPRRLVAHRGRLLGPGYRLLALAGGQRFQTRQIFTGGQKARVELVALDPGAFSLAVAEDGPRVLCHREGIAGHLGCDWVPAFSMPHEIAVENARAKPARFYLLTY